MAAHSLGSMPTHVAVDIPAALINLREAHAPFGHAAREQAVVGECAGLLCVFTVEGPGARGFVAHVGQFGHRSLHAKRHLVFLNASVGLRIAELFVGHLVDGVDAVDKCRAACRWSCPGGLSRYSTGAPSERKATPEYSLERNPLLHSLGEMGC